MKRENDNINSDNSASQLDRNMSRLLKQTDQSKKPGRIFQESLIKRTLDELKQSEIRKTDSKHLTIRSAWLEKTVGWAAMFAAAFGAGLVIVISAFLKMNLLLEVTVVLIMVFNWFNNLGGRI